MPKLSCGRRADTPCTAVVSRKAAHVHSFCDKKRVLQRLLNLRRSFFTAIVRYAAALIVPKNAFRQHLFALQKYRWLCHAKRKSTRRCFDKKAMVNALLQRPPLFLVLAVGLEPTRCHQHRILSPTRLPFHHASK